MITSQESCKVERAWADLGNKVIRSKLLSRLLPDDWSASEAIRDGPVEHV